MLKEPNHGVGALEVLETVWHPGLVYPRRVPGADPCGGNVRNVGAAFQQYVPVVHETIRVTRSHKAHHGGSVGRQNGAFILTVGF